MIRWHVETDLKDGGGNIETDSKDGGHVETDLN